MNVLMVAEAPELAVELRRRLIERSFSVRCISRDSCKPDRVPSPASNAVVLDFGSGTTSGLSLLRGWRANGMSEPVLVIGHLSTIEDRLECIDAEADDFLPTPVDLDDLVARIIALSRRSLSREPAVVIEHRGLKLNLRTQSVSLQGQALDLTNLEYRILRAFMQQPGLVLSRRQLWDRAWETTDTLDSNLVEVYMSRLRSKLRAISAEAFFQTVRGTGYTLR